MMVVPSNLRASTERAFAMRLQTLREEIAACARIAREELELADVAATLDDLNARAGFANLGLRPAPTRRA